MNQLVPIADQDAEKKSDARPSRGFLIDHRWTVLVGALGFLAYAFGDAVTKGIAAVVGSEFVNGGKVDAAALLTTAVSAVQLVFQRNAKQTGEAVKGVVSNELSMAMVVMQTRQTQHEAEQEAINLSIAASTREIAQSLAAIVQENIACHQQRQAHTALLMKHSEAFVRIGEALRRLGAEIELPDLSHGGEGDGPSGKHGLLGG